MISGLGHQQDGISQTDGSMAIFCLACLQLGINPPNDWKVRYTQYVTIAYVLSCPMLLIAYHKFI